MSDRIIGRRNFMKLVGIGLATAPTVLEIVPRINNEVPPSWRIVNGLKVCRELVDAEISGDNQQIIEARKLAVAWIFAESASLFAKNAGMEKAGETMEHYLYGDGKDLDISSWFDGVVNQGNFWRNLTQSAFGYLNLSLTGNTNFSNISKDKFLNTFNVLSKKVKTGYTFASSVSPDDQTGSEWYYAIGRSTYTMSGDINIIPGDNKYILNFKNMKGRLFDKYDWELGFEGSLSNKAGLGQSIDNLQEKIDQTNEWATGNKNDELREKDLAKLKKIGAMDYVINADFFKPDKLSVSTSTVNFLSQFH